MTVRALSWRVDTSAIKRFEPERMTMNAMSVDKKGYDTLPLVLIVTAVSVVMALLMFEHALTWAGVAGLIGLIISTRWLISRPGGRYGWWPKIIVVCVCLLLNFSIALAGLCDLLQWVGVV
jgi:hypothetical protein